MDIRITHVISLDTALMAVLMSSVSGAAIAVASPAPKASAPTPVAEPAPNAVAVAVAPAAGDIAGAASDDGTLDSAGWPWSSELHASTKGITKEGLWRMKVGVSRPDPKPGFPKADGGIGTTTNGTASPAAAPVASAIAAPADEEDEFAAFTAAAAVQSGTVAAPVAREWTDADLGALCNQAALKMGSPDGVRALIAEYTPGLVAHSRNVPADKRSAFAAAIEAGAGIVFEG